MLALVFQRRDHRSFETRPHFSHREQETVNRAEGKKALYTLPVGRNLASDCSWVHDGGLGLERQGWESFWEGLEGEGKKI